VKLLSHECFATKEAAAAGVAMYFNQGGQVGLLRSRCFSTLWLANPMYVARHVPLQGQWSQLECRHCSVSQVLVRAMIFNLDILY
jgi:hypothetical protein